MAGKLAFGDVSIRAKIFLAFFGVCLFLALYGLWSIVAISRAGAIVKDTYDRPLQAINYARAANADFHKARLYRLGLNNEPLSAALNEAAAEPTVLLLLEDLEIADERSLSAESREVISEIRTAVEKWRDGGTLEERRLAEEIGDLFEVLLETMAADSFLERQKAVDAIDRSFTLGASALGASILLALALAWLVGHQITRPLFAAASVARRISEGDLQAEIPRGGRDETGVLLASMRVMQDSINAMIRREEQRRRSAESRLTESLENAGAAILLLDANGAVVHANSQVASFVPELKAVLERGEDFTAALSSLALEVSHSGLPFESLIEGLTSSDEISLADGRWLSVTRSETSDGGAVLIWTDISELKDREERLQIAKVQAEAANRAKTRFLANMTHELKTPLHSIIGFSEVLHNESFGPLGSDQYKEYINYIMKGGRGLLSLIMDVLDIARGEATGLELNLEPVCVGDIMESAADAYRGEAEKAGLTITVETGDEDALVWGERARLIRVLKSLLSNAVKFSRDGGEIVVSARASGAAVEIIVADSGIGMSADDIAVALSAFDQVDNALARNYEGAGIGLAFVKTVIESHGGRLDIESAPGDGARVSVFLHDAEKISAEDIADARDRREAVRSIAA